MKKLIIAVAMACSIPVFAADDVPQAMMDRIMPVPSPESLLKITGSQKSFWDRYAAAAKASNEWYWRAGVPNIGIGGGQLKAEQQANMALHKLAQTKLTREQEAIITPIGHDDFDQIDFQLVAKEAKLTTTQKQLYEQYVRLASDVLKTNMKIDRELFEARKDLVAALKEDQMRKALEYGLIDTSHVPQPELEKLYGWFK